jgi:hypothetical protein
MTVRDYDRIRFITSHFGVFKGLQTLVPLGLIFLLGGLASALSSWIFTSLNLITLVGVMYWFTAGSNKYYRTRFGEVRQLGVDAAGRRQSLLFLVSLGVLLVLLIALLGPSLLHRSAGAVERLDYALFGSVHLLLWIWLECRLSQAYRLVAGGLLLAAAIPVHSASGFLLPMLAHRGVGSIAAGASYIVVGLLDHWQLVRYLPRPAEVEEEEEALPGLAENHR